MPVPDYQTLMQPLLALIADGQPHPIADLHHELCRQFRLTAEEIKARIPSGGQTYMRNRVGWARTYLNKAGLLEIPARAQVRITERGLQALAACPNRIDLAYLKQYDEFKAFTTPKRPGQENQESDTSVDTPITPDEQIETAFQTLNQSLGNDLLGALKAGSFEFFEKVVVDLMLAMGYGGSRKDAGQATQATNDDGIDGIIKEDRLGLDVIYLQAKRWDKTVHRPEIDKFIGALTRKRARKGVFITTSDFSNGAKEAANSLEMKVVLIDGQQLAELMIEHNLGVTRKAVYEVKQIDSDYFSEDN
ncbi:MAG: restriction endonuclease [Candidatus Thiodiazotropha sp. (ex Dulcina madagascariensis)]|nr:restriction endonuclease [Candidatus Thiodiazotropha sp. (ex Dulcina madagascariensis)]